MAAETLDASHRLGAAAVRALLALARDNGTGVLDSVWVDRERAVADLGALPAQVVEVFCGGDQSRHPLGGPWPLVEVDTNDPVEPYAVIERILVEADAAAQGVSLPARPLQPIDIHGDRVLLAGTAARWVRTLAAGGYTPDPFAMVLTLRGVPELVAPANWLSGPPDWSMGWGDPAPDEWSWARDALARTSVRHRASALVSPDSAAGVVRVEVRHGTTQTVETLELTL